MSRASDPLLNVTHSFTQVAQLSVSGGSAKCKNRSKKSFKKTIKHTTRKPGVYVNVLFSFLDKIMMEFILYCAMRTPSPNPEY